MPCVIDCMQSRTAFRGIDTHLDDEVGVCRHQAIRSLAENRSDPRTNAPLRLRGSTQAPHAPHARYL